MVQVMKNCMVVRMWLEMTTSKCNMGKLKPHMRTEATVVGWYRLSPAHTINGLQDYFIFCHF